MLLSLQELADGTPAPSGRPARASYRLELRGVGGRASDVGVGFVYNRAEDRGDTAKTYLGYVCKLTLSANALAVNVCAVRGAAIDEYPSRVPA
jgi:hypothetical protein